MGEGRQALAPDLEQESRALDAANRRRELAVQRAATGALIGPDDMCAIWGISRSQFYRLRRLGKFDLFKPRKPIGPHCYSGLLVTRYLEGLAVYEPVFGRKASA